MILRTLCRLVMLEQVVFSLPWSLAAIILAWDARLPEASLRAFLAILAVIIARTIGMSFNRWIDYRIDFANPRTATRPLQSGQVNIQQVVMLTVANLVLLLMIAASLGSLFLALFPLVIGLLALYSYSKRFTWLCHVILGSIHALGPVLSYVVICGHVDVIALLLGASAGFSITAADIVYSMQDMQHDKQVGLYSIPARFGFSTARLVSFLFYLASVASLGVCGFLIWNYSFFFWGPWALFAALPVWLHVNLNLKEGLYKAFFRCTSLMPFMALLAIILGKGFGR